jgi:polyisoprenoid-binding protein YceI
MKRVLAAATVAFLVPAFASAETWNIDPDHTSSTFEVTHLLVSKVRGGFGATTGTIDINDKDLTKSKLDVVIDASSISTGNADRDKHLRGEDFFWVEKHPKLTFVSTKVEKGKGKDNYKVTGDLTMRGITKPVTLDVSYTGQETKTPWGTVVRGASATATINRKDWSIIWNKTLDGGGLTVSDNVKLMIDAEFNSKPAAPAAAEAPKTK